MNNTLVSGYELSASQKRLWLQFDNCNSGLNNQISIELNSTINIELLTVALERVVSQTSVLHTSLDKSDASLTYPLQTLERSSALNFCHENIAAMGAEKQQLCIADYRASMIQNNKISSLEAQLYILDNERHFFVLTAPAIFVDQISLVKITNSIIEEYNGHATDKEEVVEFYEYAAWSNTVISEASEEAKSFWEERERLTLEKDAISMENTVWQADTFLSKTAPVKVDKSVVGSYCNRLKIDKEAFVLSIWSVLLWQYLDKPSQLAFGRMSNGRSIESFESLIGPLSKTLPFKVSITEDMTVEELLEKVTNELDLEDEWQDDYDVTGLKTLFNFEFADLTGLNETLQLADLNLFNENTKLKLVCVNTDSGLNFDLYFNPTLFSSEAITCITNQLSQLVRTFVEEEKSTIGECITVSAFEEDLIHNVFNNTNIDLDQGPSLVYDIEQISKVYAKKIALKDDVNTVTFEELNISSNKIANLLIERHSIKMGDVVAIMLPRGTILIECLLGILKAGAAFLPLDPSLPAKRVSYILQDSDAKVLFTDGDSHEFSEHVDIINSEALRAAGNGSPTNINRSSSDTSYIMYTSGSTGKPKGVVISDESISNYTHWFIHSNSIDHTDSTILFTTIAFDLNYTALWTSLAAGATLYLTDESPVFDPDSLWNSIIEEQVTYIKLTPSHFNLLVNSNQFKDYSNMHKLRLVVSGGEPIAVNDVQSFLQSNGHVHFMNHFGPTESTVGVVSHSFNCDQFEKFKHKPVIGNPIYNNSILIVDKNTNQVPIGVVGEMVVTGKNVASGYINNEELTTLKFITSLENHHRVYKTGDLGRWLPDGTIEFIGRQDFQIKIRGYRIELDEIENLLRSFSEIQNAYVTTASDGDGEPYLTAFYTSNSSVEAKSIKLQLEQELPIYMVPQKLKLLESFPLLANGKVDRNVILNYLTMESTNTDEIVAPKTEIELLIAEHWKEVLNVEVIDVHDMFFEIGGNSFKLVKVFKGLSKKFPQKIALTDLFKHSSIHELAQFLENKEIGAQETTFGFEV